MEIAVVGMGAVLPGCDSLEEFWQSVLEARDLQQSVPGGRWSRASSTFIAHGDTKDRVFHDKGYFCKDIPKAPTGLEVSQELWEQLDPVFHLALKAGRDAFYDGKWRAVDRQKMGVILGNIALPTEGSANFVRHYFDLSIREGLDLPLEVSKQEAPQNYFTTSLPANLLATALGLGLESFTLDAACASSLYALKYACDRLESGEADAMLAGGICRSDSLYTQMGFTQLKALSSSGVCRPFDSRGDGLMVGEGGAIFFLKRLQDAREQGDRIYGVIRGAGIANDMSGKLMAPSSQEQLRAISGAYQQCGWKSEDVDYIECHATGTPLGDKVELETLRLLLGERQNPCVISSIKGNIGHLLTAAGATGLVRLLLAMKHQQLPPSCNYTRPLEGDADRPYKILKNPEHWQKKHGVTRKAGISGFGFGGVNAHLLIEEYTANHDNHAEAVTPHQLRPVAIVGIDRSTPSSSPGQSMSCFGFNHQSWFKKLGFTVDSEQFDNIEIPFGLLKIPPKEIEAMLPQQLEAMISTKTMLKGMEGLKFSGERTGVYVGLELDGMVNSYRSRWDREATIEEIIDRANLSLSQDEKEQLSEQLKDATFPYLTADGVMGSLASIIASRIAKELKSGGPAITISNLENSGLSALKLAIDAIQRQELDTAVVSAVDMAGGVFCRLATQSLWSSWEGHKELTFVDSAVTIALQDWELAKRSGAKIYGRIDGVSGRIDDDDSYLPPRSILSLAQSKGHGNVTHQTFDYRSVHHISPQLLGGWEDVAIESHSSEYYGAATGLMRFVEALHDYDVTPNLSAKPFLYGFHATNRCTHWLVGEPQSITAEPIKEELLPQNSKQRIKIPNLAKESRLDSIKALSVFRNRQGGRKRNHSTDRSHPSAAPMQQHEATPFPRNDAFWNHLLEQMANTELSNQEAQKVFADTAKKAMEYSMKIAEDIGNRRGASSLGLFMPAWSPQQDVSQEATPAEVIKYIPMNQEPALFDYEACEEFAAGKIGNVFGDDFAQIDRYPTRVRLPTDRLLLCHRVMLMKGEKKSLKAGSMITEHDINSDSWYLDQGKIPTSIAIEAGQADLMLSAWLGADDHTRGLARYRLLDAQVTFFDVLPSAGQFIRYEIHIDHFFRRGDTLLFRFGFDAYVKDRPLMSMVDGCAGFFTNEELNQGKGIIKNEASPKSKGNYTGGYYPLFTSHGESYSEKQLDFLRAGQLTKCFGPQFNQLAVKTPLGIPGGDLRLVHRIQSIDTFGGRYGVGLVIGEADINPDDWFLTCHFIDDPVMPGTLMYECCLHTLRVFLLRHGWVGDAHQVCCEPVAHQPSRLKCRGQVLPSSRKVSYELHIKEMGYGPFAYVLVDAYMYCDDKCIVDIENMTLQLTGLTKDAVEKSWVGQSEKPLFPNPAIVEFASGRPSQAFGDPYKPFDSGRRMARLPRGKLQLVSQIISSTAEPFQLAEGTSAIGEYENTATTWFYMADPSHYIPFSVLLEIALQPCGWLAAFMGSALTSKQDLFFRNLQGKAQYIRKVGRKSGCLTIEVATRKIAKSADMIIQEYAFIVKDKKGPVYKGETAFGFFTESALSQQQGLKNIESYGVLGDKKATMSLPLSAGFPGYPLLMVDEVEPVNWSAGKYGLGRVIGYKYIKKEDWYFHDHFYQDPVMPGSLGLEAMVQLGKYAASQNWSTSECFSLEEEHSHSWIYRGQVLPHNQQLCIDLHIRHIDNEMKRLSFDALLYCDGLLIYRAEEICLRVEV